MTTFATPTPPRLDLSVPCGRIELAFGERTETEVELIAISGGDAAAEAIATARVDVHGEGAERTVTVQVPEQRKLLRHIGRQPEIHLRVLAPTGAIVEAGSISAELRCGSGAGSLRFKTMSGEARCGDAAGDVRIETASGGIVVGAVGGDLRATSMSGDIHAGAVSGTVHAKSMSGSINVDGARGGIRASTMSGNVDAGGLEHGDADLGSMSGDIRAAVVPGVRVYLDLSTLAGRATSELDVGDDQAGDAQLHLKASTKSGDVVVRRQVALRT
jgi:hypothetical protein